jgi:uncharacterized damage-inducible protein DinB
MIEPMPWTERRFAFDAPVGAFPSLVERLHGTPARAADLVAGCPDDVLAARLDGKWSVKEHLGHLADLATLDEKRLAEFLRRVEVLSAADVENRATEEANHRQAPIASILKKLREGRMELTGKLEALTLEEVSITALHPRLKKPMRLLDWVYFVAEHDDHHLAKARYTMLRAGARATRSGSR